MTPGARPKTLSRAAGKGACGQRGRVGARAG